MDDVANTMNRDYFAENAETLFKLDIIPHFLLEYLPKDKEEKIEAFVEETMHNRGTPDYAGFRSREYAKPTESWAEYSLRMLNEFVEKHPEHSKLLN